MFFLILVIWIAILFSLRVALFGNPLRNLVQRQRPELLQDLDRNMERRNLAVDDEGEAGDFIRRFSRWTALETGAFFLEIGILIYLLLGREFEHPMYFWLGVVLLGKNMVVLMVGWMHSRNIRHGLFSHLLKLPSWILALDRVSAVLSCAGFTLLLLKISGIWSVGGSV